MLDVTKDESSSVESGKLSCSTRPGNELEFIWRPDGTTADLCWACS